VVHTAYPKGRLFETGNFHLRSDFYLQQQAASLALVCMSSFSLLEFSDKRDARVLAVSAPCLYRQHALCKAILLLSENRVSKNGYFGTTVRAMRVPGCHCACSMCERGLNGPELQLNRSYRCGRNNPGRLVLLR
jgi:hypothetical protein